MNKHDNTKPTFMMFFYCIFCGVCVHEHCSSKHFRLYSPKKPDETRGICFTFQASESATEVCQYNKGRELLAQGLSYAKNMERSQEQERAERALGSSKRMSMGMGILVSFCVGLSKISRSCLASGPSTSCGV